MVNSVVTIQIQLNAREELSEFAIFFPAELFSVSLQESLELLGTVGNCAHMGLEISLGNMNSTFESLVDYKEVDARNSEIDI